MADVLMFRVGWTLSYPEADAHGPSFLFHRDVSARAHVEDLLVELTEQQLGVVSQMWVLMDNGAPGDVTLKRVCALPARSLRCSFLFPLRC